MALVKWKLEAEIEETIDDDSDNITTIVQPDEIARLIRAAMPDKVTIPSIKMHMTMDRVDNVAKDS